jgi:glycosyltransferase involved in cell wall biosynthesis
MPKTPFFSIIIPTFNRADKLDIPIKSILNQEFKNWELIIIDDGSIDKTKELVASFNQNNIHYFHQNNRGKSAARNLGITKAIGKYICFQDSDDEYLPNHLQILYDYISENEQKVSLVRTGIMIYENGKFKKKSSLTYHSWNNVFPFENFTTAAIYYKLFKETRFPEAYFINEDLYFLLQLKNLTTCHVIEKWTGIYHFDSSNSGAKGLKYEDNMLNKRACLEDILSWHYSTFRTFVIKQRCLTEILLLAGHIKYQPKKVFKAVGMNLKIFIRFPLAYSYLCFRIIYVKWGEWSGLYRTKDRF